MADREKRRRLVCCAHCCPLHCRLNVLVMSKQVRRIVLVLHSHKPLVIRPVGGLDALRSLVGLQADLVDLVATRDEGTQHLRQLARPSNVHVVCSWVRPARQAAPLA